MNIIRPIGALAACAIVLAGCDYTVPLLTPSGAPIDGQLIGLWERTNETGRAERLLVLPLSRSEYLVSYPAGDSGAMYAKAWPAAWKGLALVQMEWFGTANGGTPDDARVYQLARYAITGSNLTVRLVNADVLPREATSSQALGEALDKNRDDPKLFREPLSFGRARRE